MAGVVDTTQTFTTDQVITSTAMNNIIDQTLFTSDAISGTTLALTAGKLKVATSGITSNEMGANAVTTTAILNGAVTTAKIADGNVTTVKIADSNVTTEKIADSNVTTVKIADANVTPAKLSEPLTLGTVQSSTSGTSINFTGIPSWAKKVTIMFSSVSISGTSNILVQIGDAGGIETTGYTSQCQFLGVANYPSAIGFSVTATNIAAETLRGVVTLYLISASSNTWVSSSLLAGSTAGYIFPGTGGKTLSETLDRVRITTTNGTDTFDAGSINILYE